ncbi:MAG: NAD-dependent protein deacylase [Finegoldia sp.]|nr:NAD-dependent protein deacylase [Finegoldia sp.]
MADYELLDKVKDIIEKSDKIVFFGGAGVSTASGIPDFRSATGLYNQENDTGYSPEYMLSREFFDDHPDNFQTYVLNNLIIDGVKPNDAHKALKKLEDAGKLLGVITQNIDGLDREAGTENVAELHGSLNKYYCVDCGRDYDLDYYKGNKPPICKECGGIVRPDITLYGEVPPQDEFLKAIMWIQKADTMIVAGSSLVVYPASALLNYFKGDNLILINYDETDYDRRADYLIHDDIAKSLSYICKDI